MIELLIAGAVVGVVTLVGNIFKFELRNEAARQQRVWEQEHYQTEQAVIYYSEQVRQRKYEAQARINFQAMTELHFEAMKTADYAYGLLTNTRLSVDTIGLAIVTAREKRDLLIATLPYSNGLQWS